VYIGMIGNVAHASTKVKATASLSMADSITCAMDGTNKKNI